MKFWPIVLVMLPVVVFAGDRHEDRIEIKTGTNNTLYCVPFEAHRCRIFNQQESQRLIERQRSEQRLQEFERRERLRAEEERWRRVDR